METKIYTVEELKNLFLQELINKTDGKVTKVSDHSVLNGVAFGFAKSFQKSMKDIALLESELFPEYAYGEYLDKIAERYGISPRQKNLGSTVYVKLVATPHSAYLADNCNFVSSEGQSFELVSDFVVGANGWGYAQLKSVDTGEDTNVAAGTINKVTGQPTGHIYVVNELPATGGVSQESDEDFLQRILQNFNNFSFETLDKLTAVYQTINPNVLQVRKVGVNMNSQVVLSIVTVNGATLTSAELDELKQRGTSYLSLQDLFVVNDLQGGLDPVILQNVEVVPIDLDFRVQLDSIVNVEDFKVSAQEALVSLLDISNKTYNTVEWEDLFVVIKNQTGVRVLPEQYFFAGSSDSWTPSSPHSDITIPATKIARIRSFVVRDLNGTLLFDNEGEFVPYYYGPNYSNVFSQINNSI